MPSPARCTGLALLALAGCAATRRDPWSRASDVLRDGDVVALVQTRHDGRNLELTWCGVRAEGESRLISVRMLFFSDANGDLEPQPEEQLTRWEDAADEPQREFSVYAAFRSTNVPPQVLERLRVATEVVVEGRSEPLRGNRALP